MHLSAPVVCTNQNSAFAHDNRQSMVLVEGIDDSVVVFVGVSALIAVIIAYITSPSTHTQSTEPASSTAATSQRQGRTPTLVTPPESKPIATGVSASTGALPSAATRPSLLVRKDSRIRSSSTPASVRISTLHQSGLWNACVAVALLFSFVKYEPVTIVFIPSYSFSYHR